ncbi:hypothetical protein F5B22DRAFT_596645 [Xylaria bambusicola]|uniref:uncharacterized protein n=1 Tax=Xylaria bambusicola TaxID=326684 RepID=UPI002008CA9A|nr:uncharacterized protein F5B22DRAFT_596645 [Xylaria bambusicola]KAI0521372.1 hypothetical protein F5B22DRAFT_596645 [Xylaria bambusicola]
MHLFALLFLPLSFVTQVMGTKFVSPIFQDTAKVGPYARNGHWPLGSTQVVAFATPWKEYRLELWQQSLAGGSARRSSQFTYKQKANGTILPQSFQWTVQTYELQLSSSPIFFFWLFHGTSDAQQSSAYFNITVNASPDSETVSRVTPTTSTETSNVVSSISTIVAPTSIPLSSDNVSNGLSTGAKAGIGVGASLGGILVLIVAGVVFMKRKSLHKERQQVAELHDSQTKAYSFNPSTTVVITGGHNSKPDEVPQYYYEQPSELRA